MLIFPFSFRRGFVALRSAMTVVLAVWLVLTVHGAMAQTTDVFGRTASGAPDAANVAGGSGADAASGANVSRSVSGANVAGSQLAQSFAMPEFVRRAVGMSVRLQSELNEDMQDALTNQRDGTSLRAAWLLVLLSFGYGVLHALGPGHGKLAVSTYLASHRARVVHAAALSVWSACVQALSAIVLVGGAAWLTREGLGGVLTRASSLELVSYIALIGVGLWTLWSVASRRDCCDDGRVRLVPGRRRGFLQRVSGFGTEESSRDETSADASYLGANRMGSNRGNGRWAPASQRSGPVWIARQIFMTGLAVGVRPCAGAIFVLIAALANGIFMVGVLSAFAMAGGVALTVFAIGLSSLGINRFVSRKRMLRSQAVEQIRYRLALGGAVFITLFAAWQACSLLLGLRAAGLA